MKPDPLDLSRHQFVTWAVDHQFEYPDWARPFLVRCESAAEAFFAREFVRRPHAKLDGVGRVACAGVTLDAQAPVGLYRVDFLIERAGFRFGVEIDGYGFHHINREQVARDYQRERALLCLGLAVVRFTASEAFAKARSCWKEVDAILDHHGRTAR